MLKLVKCGYKGVIDTLIVGINTVLTPVRKAVYALEDHTPYCLMVSSGQPAENASDAAAFLRLWSEMVLARDERPTATSWSLSTRAKNVVGTGLQLSGNMSSGSNRLRVGVSCRMRVIANTGHSRESAADDI